jgi:hypothetical protein
MKLALRVLVVLCGLACHTAYGWLRPWHEDAVVVQRSELIVVGHLLRGSIESAHPGGVYRQYNARLAITDILKGASEETEIPLTIYHGLTPIVGGYINEDGMKMDFRPLRKGMREDSIEIIDTGSSTISFNPSVPDAGEDNLWFLRRRSGMYGREPGVGAFGIVDPEDLQQLSLKDYFLAYLSENPEAEVRRQMSLQPNIELRAQRYLDHLEVHRILRVPEPETRIERLLPFYIKGQAWSDGLRSTVGEARQGIIDCGKVSATYLRTVFDDPSLERLKEDVIEIWGELRFEGCVEVLIAGLKENDRFWSEQHLEKDWWNRDYGSELTQKRRGKYGEVYHSVIALGKIGDIRALRTIELTRRRWNLINFDNPQIVEECEKALKLLRGAEDVIRKRR